MFLTMSGTWRKFKRSLSSKFSLPSASVATGANSSRSSSSSAAAAAAATATASTTTAATTSATDTVTATASSSRPPRTPPSSSTSSSSLGSRLSRSLSLQPSSKTCAICLRSMKKGQGEAIFFAECSHPFHFNCIADNVKHGNLRCPICRCEWKDIPFQAPANGIDTQLLNAGRGAQVSPYNTPPVQLEPERFCDDEALVVVSAAPSSSPVHSQPVSVEVFPEYPAVPASSSLSKFGVLLRIRAPPLDNTESRHRAPIDLVTVLDVSGSMTDKLPLLKRAVIFIIQNLGPSDRLSIVTFSSSARRILPLRRMSNSGQDDAINAINSLSANGGTSIVAGLTKGVRVLEERCECNPVASILLLSDGRDTHGCSSRDKLEYLKLLPASIYNYNDGIGEENTRATIPVYTFGFGSDHDSTSMHAISDASGGTFSFIESIDILQDAFARCIGGLLSIVVQDFRVEIKSLSAGVKIGSIPSGRYKSEISDQNHEAVIDIGDLYAEEEKEFLVYISVPESSTTDGMERIECTPLVRVSCLHKDSTSSNAVHMEGEKVEIQRPSILSPTDASVSLEVDRQRNRVEVTTAISNAQKMAEMGNLVGAQELLAEQRLALLSTASAQAEDGLCNALEVELREIKARMESRELYDASGRAYVLSGMSSHSWQRATTRGHTTICLSTNGVPENVSMASGYDTPSMTSMVSKSQTLCLGPRA